MLSVMVLAVVLSWVMVLLVAHDAVAAAGSGY